MSGAQTIHAGASLGLPAPWTDQTGTALRRPDGSDFVPSPALDVARAYAIASYGDSRANVRGTSIGFVGSGTWVGSQKFPTYVGAYLGDAEFVADFGVGGDILQSWNSPTRFNGKTIGNLLALRPDAVVVQYGINDLPAASSATLIAAAKALVAKLVSSGIKVVLQNIMTFVPTATTPNITPANAAATLAKINAFRDAMAAFIAPMTGRAAFVDPNPLITDSGTGYGDPQYFVDMATTGVHSSIVGAQIIGKQTADALRILLPARGALAVTTGPLSQPNLINWGDGPATNAAYAVENGSATVSTPTWYVDPTTGESYLEATVTPTALASGTCRVRLEVWAEGISGATPRHRIYPGDVLQGSARVVYDDGAGGPVQVISSALRHRLFNSSSASQFFADWCATENAAGPILQEQVNCRMAPAACVCPIGSATIQAPTISGGYYVATWVETTVLSPVRVRMYSPAARVVSLPQPASVTAGASPYAWINNPPGGVANDWVNRGSSVMLTIAPGAGGTISKIELTRGASIGGAFPAPVTTGLTAGVFRLDPGDGVIVTWSTTAAVLTVTPLS